RNGHHSRNRSCYSRQEKAYTVIMKMDWERFESHSGFYVFYRIVQCNYTKIAIKDLFALTFEDKPRPRNMLRSHVARLPSALLRGRAYRLYCLANFTANDIAIAGFRNLLRPWLALL